jgi:hypothetical protein
MRKSLLFLVTALVVLAAGLGIAWAAMSDEPAGGDQTTTTLPAEPGTAHGPVYLDSVEVLLLESYPVQVRALVKGSLPTPCHSLDWEVSGPDDAGRITLDLYSTAEDGAVCVQVLEPFEESIDVGSFASGSYVLVVGGVEYPFTI